MKIFPVIRKVVQVVQAAVDAVNFRAGVTPAVSITARAEGTPDKPLVRPGVSLNAGLATLLTNLRPALAITTRGEGTPAPPAVNPAPKLSTVATMSGSPQNPAMNLVQVRYDLTHRRGGSTVVTSTGWSTPANAVDNNGIHNDSQAIIAGSLGGNSGTLILSYPAQPNRDLIVSSVKLFFYYVTSATWTLGTMALAYSLDNGSNFTTLVTNVAPGNRLHPNPLDFDITTAVGGDWTKIAALQTRMLVNFNSGSATEAVGVDAVEIEVIASRTDAL